MACLLLDKDAFLMHRRKDTLQASGISMVANWLGYWFPRMQM